MGLGDDPVNEERQRATFGNPKDCVERQGVNFDVESPLIKDLRAQLNQARAIAAEGRKAGRAEAARILMEQDAETFPGDASYHPKSAFVFSEEIGISGDYATRWNEAKVRELFELDKERTAFDEWADRVEEESWEQHARDLERQEIIRERDALRASLERLEALRKEWLLNVVQLRQEAIRIRNTIKAPTGAEERCIVRAEIWEQAATALAQSKPSTEEANHGKAAHSSGD